MKFGYQGTIPYANTSVSPNDRFVPEVAFPVSSISSWAFRGQYTLSLWSHLVIPPKTKVPVRDWLHTP